MITIYKKLIIPFTILVIIFTLRVSSYINDEKYYDNIKDKFTEEIDVITLAKEFLGKLQFIYFKENDWFVSSNEEKTEIANNVYYVKTDTNKLLSKNSGIVSNIKKSNNIYTVTIRCEGVTITYYNLYNIEVSLYDYIEVGDLISEINYEYVVQYA